LRSRQQTPDDGADTVPDPLAEHGIYPQVRALELSSQSIGAALLEEAHRAEADLLIMGAYARHPLFELILGGPTCYMMAHADLPVLMRH
jgi:nucleotide-binding universal stress UspA family protein